MKISKFKYNKEDETKEYELLILESNDKHISGINLGYLNEEEKDVLLKLQKKYEEDLKPFMKAYRKFLNEKIINE